MKWTQWVDCKLLQVGLVFAEFESITSKRGSVFQFSFLPILSQKSQPELFQIPYLLLSSLIRDKCKRLGQCIYTKYFSTKLEYFACCSLCVFRSFCSMFHCNFLCVNKYSCICIYLKFSLLTNISLVFFFRPSVFFPRECFNGLQPPKLFEDKLTMSILSMSSPFACFVAVNAFLGFFKFEQIKKYIYRYLWCFLTVCCWTVNSIDYLTKLYILLMA